MKNRTSSESCSCITRRGRLTACSDDEPDVPVFVENARILENGETLSPGTIVHLEGRGYLETDDVILDFFWETGDKLIGRGYHRVLCKSHI